VQYGGVEKLQKTVTVVSQISDPFPFPSPRLDQGVAHPADALAELAIGKSFPFANDPFFFGKNLFGVFEKANRSQRDNHLPDLLIDSWRGAVLLGTGERERPCGIKISQGKFLSRLFLIGNALVKTEAVWYATLVKKILLNFHRSRR
jgi:hypothetical protein